MDFLMDAEPVSEDSDFRISNYDLMMMELISYCTDHNVDRSSCAWGCQGTLTYFEQQEKFVAQLRDTVKIVGKVAVIDLRPFGHNHTETGSWYMPFGRRLNQRPCGVGLS